MRKNNRRKEWQVPRALFWLFFSFLTFLFIVYTYISVSPIVLGINIQEFATTRNTYETILRAKRGTIYDSDGNTLALNVYSYTVIAYLEPSRTIDETKPQHVVDVDGTAKALSPLLNMTEEELINLLSLDRYQVELGPGGRGITELKKEEIQKLNLPGIDFVESSKRFYPNGDFASYVIGYAKSNEHEVDGETIIQIDGELGIESKYDDELKGVDGYLSYQQDAKGYQIPETEEKRIPAQDGSDIYLTINAGIQRFVEEAMDEAEANYNYEWLQIHIMDAKTGDIVASASSPSFDPNVRDIVNYENNLTSIVIEPGSVMKTFTYMCAMEKGTYQGDKTFMSGTITVGDTYIKDWNNYGWGSITYDYGYEQSSNVGITNMLLIDNFIGADDLRDCLNKYGFGKTTGIELPAEASGKLEFYYPIEIATAGFGQGIYVTPVQILQGYSILANNGRMLKPHIISKIVNPNTNEVTYERQIEESDQIVSVETVNKMKNLMYNVVNSPTGSGRSYSTLNYGVELIGKTGTAQIYENGGYLKNQYIRSFSGMFPKENPRYLIYGAIKKVYPDGNAALTSTVKKIVQNVSKYFNISTNTSSINSYNVGNYVSKSTSGVTKALQELGLNPIVIGDGDYIINQYPNNNNTILVGEKIFLLTNSNNYKMPSMKGWSRTDVLAYFNLIGVKCTINGEGYVVSQSIGSGTTINLDSEIVVELQDKY
ncbi:MAG: penicillin-binding protein [Bacilli bacterium]|nr:penicillin-binding protein [Bacilli bacterium]